MVSCMRDFVCHNPEKQYLDKLLQYVNETRQLLSSKMKQERERMVCRAFLRCIGLPFREDQIIVSTDEPPDIIFDSARFEIRELLDDGRRRGDEWAQEARKAERAEDIGLFHDPFHRPGELVSWNSFRSWPTHSERNVLGMVPNVADWMRWSM
jgi:Putative endonuclease, protein of unknown function (DUF1780)